MPDLPGVFGTTAICCDAHPGARSTRCRTLSGTSSCHPGQLVIGQRLERGRPCRGLDRAAFILYQADAPATMESGL